jgi:hypothetical protein
MKLVVIRHEGEKKVKYGLIEKSVRKQSRLGQ